jgi:hypothetical protein
LVGQGFKLSVPRTPAAVGLGRIVDGGRTLRVSEFNVYPSLAAVDEIEFEAFKGICRVFDIEIAASTNRTRHGFAFPELSLEPNDFSASGNWRTTLIKICAKL